MRTWVMLLALLAAALRLAPAAQADPITELFFSEYLEGSGNNKALEIFNGTGAAVDLAAHGYAVQVYFNGNSTPGLTINLLGTVAPGDVFVLAHSGAIAAILAQADQLSGSTFFNGDDAVALLRGAVLLDVVGQIGLDPGIEWGAGLTGTADNTLRRHLTVTRGDPDGADAFDPALEWTGFALDVVDGLGAHAVAATPVGEPSSGVLLVGALAGLAAGLRRRGIVSSRHVRRRAGGEGAGRGPREETRCRSAGGEACLPVEAP